MSHYSFYYKRIICLLTTIYLLITKYLNQLQALMPKKGCTIKQIQKKQNLAQQELKFSDVTFTPETADYHRKLNSDIETLRKIMINWAFINQQYRQTFSEREILCDYIKYHHQYTEYDQFDSTFSLMKSLNVNLERIKSIDLIYKSYDIFRKSRWPVRFTSKFVSRLTQCNLNQLKYILSFVLWMADGNLNRKNQLQLNRYGYAKSLQTKLFAFNRFFSVKIFKEKNMLIHIGVQKIPVLGKNNTIKRYQFTSFMQFLDVLGDQIIQNPNKLQERMNIFIEKINSDVAKRDHGQQLQIDQQKIKHENGCYLFYSGINPYNGVRDVFDTDFELSHTFIKQHYLPLPFKVYYVSATQTSTLIFDQSMKRWISQDFLNRAQRRKLNQYQRKINQELVKRFVDFQSAKTLVELLTKIPNFKIKLTQQEKDVIGQNGNVMAIGRSGTGKTTCAILRLFSIEMLFKIRLSLYKKKFVSQISNTRCSSDDIDQTIGLHCIFLTASPVLTNQIQRYYKKLTQNLKVQLQKKRKRVEQQAKLKMIEQKVQDQSIIQQSGEDIQVQQQGETICQQEIQVPQQISRQKSAQVIQQQQQMKKQLKDIQLKQDVQNQDFNQDEQIFNNIKQQFQKKVKRFQSLQDLDQSDYPGFFTVKSYIMLVDGILTKPFFIRGKSQIDIVGEQAKAAWHNQRKGVMMIQNYFRNQQTQQQGIDQNAIDDLQDDINYSDEQELEHQYMRQIQLRQNKDKQNLTKKLQSRKKKNQLSFQVDFEYFATHFWPNYNKRYSKSSRNITAQLVWTQIYSTIKGSASSHQYPGQYMPEKVYLKESSNVFLTNNEKLDIYELFCRYQQWKIQNGGYDLMDAVNYILNYIRFRGYTGPEIHYVMIDQVQDLPHAIIYLLSKTASYGVFYSGDTAQTIAKGVGFRFCDLKSLFDQKLFNSSLKLAKPTIKHLTVNFRSHNNILQLANSIVSCLQILFPKTIDKLAKQRSDLDGPKPMILAQNDEQMLFYVLCGQEKSNNQQNGIKKPPLQFGCDQVIIVRDQQSKQKIPGMLQHALCLTIYQAKGLQFNDVILFNFFTQCKSPQKWSLIKYLKVVQTEISKQEYQKNLTRHNQQKQKPIAERNQKIIIQGQQQEELVDAQCTFEAKDDTVRIKKIVSDVKKIMKDINDYAELCSDLKLFYTAITRPRKTLIIYDQDPACRKIVQDLWSKLGIIQIVTKALIQSETNTQQNGTSIFKRVVSATNNNEWKKQGLKMYSRGFFQQAMKCFEKSGNEELFKKANANLLADHATKLLIEVESERNSIKQGFMGYRDLNSQQLSRLKSSLKHKQTKSYLQFNKAAQIFTQLKMFKQAGQCFFSGKCYQKAKLNFVLAKMLKQAAQSLQMLCEYKQAAQLYKKQGDYLKVIQCLDMINQWQQILIVIKQNETKMTDIQKSSLLKKYAALALEELVYQIQFQNQDPQNKTQNKPSNRIQIIQQKQSDEEDQADSYQDSDQQHPTQSQIHKIEILQNDNNDSLIKSEVKDQLLQSIYQKVQPQQIKQDDQSGSFSALNESQDSKEQTVNKAEDKLVEQIKEQKMNESVDDSFSVLNESKDQVIQRQQSQHSFSQLNPSQSSGDFSQLNIKYQKQLQPDIQSIRSLADPEDPWLANNLSQINAKSQYSIIEQDESYNMNIKIIKTKGNIIIQDQIMRKIIKIVSLINDSSNAFLKQFKGYQSLITVDKSQNQQSMCQVLDDQFMNFQEIDQPTIHLILDTLESFKLLKLCLFVCNRYHLPQKAGRYLISIMMKYSTNCQSNTIINSGLLAPSTQRKSQLQKGILGSYAVHSILENVNSDFLKIKISTSHAAQKNKNSLGSYFIEGLILEGFYKKSVFMVNPQQALHILQNFKDYELFRQICKNKFIKLQEGNDYFLQYVPKSQIQQKFCLLSLYEIIHKYQSFQKLQTISYRFYKEFIRANEQTLKQIKIPSYLPFVKSIIEENHQLLSQALKNSYKMLTNGNVLQVADSVFGLLSILYSQKLKQHLFQTMSISQFLEYYRSIKYIKNTIFKINNSKNSINIIRSLLVFYQCKMIQNYDSMSFIGQGYCFVDRTSSLANQMIEQSKANPSYFAYFFQQDFNLIMTKSSNALKIIKKKFTIKLTNLIKQRYQIQRFTKQILPEDYTNHTKQLILAQALKQAYKLITSNSDSSNKKNNKIKKGLNKDQKVSFNYKVHGKIQHAYIIQDDEQSDNDIQATRVTYNRQRYVLPNFSPEMSYLSEQLLSIFYNKSRLSQQIAVGKQLYCSNLNQYYRQYIDRKGGYNLFDAIQFKKFKRIDMYADNILAVLDTLPLIDKHVFIAEILVLLLVQYKRITSKSTNFTLKMTNNYLKYFQNMKTIQKAQQRQIHEKIINQQIRYKFRYQNKYSSSLNQSQLSELICEYLDQVLYEQSSQFADLCGICQIYIMNINPEKIIYKKLFKVVSTLTVAWQKPFYQQFSKAKNIHDFIQTRDQTIKRQTKLHVIQVNNVGNNQVAVRQSQTDYIIQSKVIQGRKKALSKISVWWKNNKIPAKFKITNNIQNYFDYAQMNQDYKNSQNKISSKSLLDYRIVASLHSHDISLNISLLFLIWHTRQDLLRFYLQHYISLSLDFHFILLTLRKLTNFTKQYMRLSNEKQSGLVEFQFKDQFHKLYQNVQELTKDITTWKSDAKWLKEKDLTIKKRKVFQVKWMTKSLKQMKIIRKRAGLKKQQKLLLKKKFLKN